jgi:hypothetical protein
VRRSSEGRYARTGTSPRLAAVPAETPRLKEALAKVRRVFEAAPGVELTTADTARVAGLDRQVCRVLLRMLSIAGFLERRTSGVFVRCPTDVAPMMARRQS